MMFQCYILLLLLLLQHLLLLLLVQLLLLVMTVMQRPTDPAQGRPKVVGANETAKVAWSASRLWIQDTPPHASHMCDQRVGTAIVRRPGPRLCEGLVTFQQRDVVSLDTALCQWQAYVDTFRRHGWKILEVDSADNCPDAVFIEV